jgi:hypothetical protein
VSSPQDINNRDLVYIKKSRSYGIVIEKIYSKGIVYEVLTQEGVVRYDKKELQYVKHIRSR